MSRKLTIIVTAGVLLSVAGGWAGYAAWGQRRETLRLPGTVETQEVRLSPRVGGRVSKIAVREGDLVQAGQPLVFIEVPELMAQREAAAARLAAAQAQLEKARNGSRSEEIAAAAATVEAMQARWERLKAGSRQEEIDQARSELEVCEAELVRTRQDMDREARLYPTSTSRAQYEAAVAAYRRCQGQTRSAQARLRLLQAGSRPEEIAEAEAELGRARAQLQLLEAGTRSEEVAEAEAKVAELQGKLRELDVNLAETTIRAAEPAVVEVLAVRPGDVVAANQPVVRVLRAEDLWVKAYVSEVDLGKVQLNQEVALTIDAYPGQRFPGVVTFIASNSEFTPRNVQSIDERRHQVFGLKVRVTDPKGVFKSGMAADVWVPVQN